MFNSIYTRAFLSNLAAAGVAKPNNPNASQLGRYMAMRQHVDAAEPPAANAPPQNSNSDR